MNKEDLKEYKHGGGHIHSLIPGINNLPSVGSSPMARKALDFVHGRTESARYSLGSGSQEGGMTRTQSHSVLPIDRHPIKDSIMNKSKGLFIRFQE